MSNDNHLSPAFLASYNEVKTTSKNNVDFLPSYPFKDVMILPHRDTLYITLYKLQPFHTIYIKMLICFGTFFHNKGTKSVSRLKFCFRHHLACQHFFFFFGYSLCI